MAVNQTCGENQGHSFIIISSVLNFNFVHHNLIASICLGMIKITMESDKKDTSEDNGTRVLIRDSTRPFFSIFDDDDEVMHETVRRRH